MIILNEKEREQLLEEVRVEFPDDEMMQQIHYIRLLHYRQTRNLSPEERVIFFEETVEKVA